MQRHQYNFHSIQIRISHGIFVGIKSIVGNVMEISCQNYNVLAKIFIMHGLLMYSKIMQKAKQYFKVMMYCIVQRFKAEKY